MTIKELKQIIQNLPDNTVLMVDEDRVKEVETISVLFHRDGRSHLMFSSFE